MNETSLSPVLTCIFEDRVDLGSWANFTSSLTRLLDEACRPPAQRGESAEAVIDPSGGTLLLTAPFPMVRLKKLVSQGHWPQLLTKLPFVTPPVPSPDLPGVVLVGCSDGVEVLLSGSNAQGRVLLGPTKCRVLRTIGWQENHHVFARLLSDIDETADLVTRILIEVLEIAYLAGLDYLLHTHSDIS